MRFLLLILPRKTTQKKHRLTGRVCVCWGVGGGGVGGGGKGGFEICGYFSNAKLNGN